MHRYRNFKLFILTMLSVLSACEPKRKVAVDSSVNPIDNLGTMSAAEIRRYINLAVSDLGCNQNQDCQSVLASSCNRHLLFSTRSIKASYVSEALAIYREKLSDKLSVANASCPTLYANPQTRCEKQVCVGAPRGLAVENSTAKVHGLIVKFKSQNAADSITPRLMANLPVTEIRRLSATEAQYLVTFDVVIEAVDYLPYFKALPEIEYAEADGVVEASVSN